MPLALQSVIETQASSAIRGRFEVGDVDLWLARGALALDDIRVLPDDQSETPVISLKRGYAQISWLDLLERAVTVRELRLDAPFVSIDLLASGAVNLAEVFAPPVDPEARPDQDTKQDAEAEQATLDESDPSIPWTFALDRLVLESGDFDLRDLSVGNEQPIALDIQKLEVARATLDPGTYELPAELQLDATLAGAPLTARVQFTPLNEGQRIHAELRSTGLPVQRARPYIGDLAWTQLTGLLDLDLHYDFENDAQHEAGGSVVLRDIAIVVEGLEAPALSWESLAVKVNNIDLLKRHADIESVTLVRALVAADAQAQTLPVLQTRKQGDDAAPEAETAPVAAGEAAVAPAEAKTGDDSEAGDGAPAPEEDSSAWSWNVNQVELTDVEIPVRTRADPIDFGLAAKVAKLASKPGQDANCDLRITQGTSALAVNGSLRLQPAGFSGEVKWDDLDLPELLALAPPGPAEIVKGAVSSASLVVRGGLAGEVPAASEIPAGEVRVKGTLDLRGVNATDDEAGPFSVKWTSLAIEADELTIPLPPNPGTMKIVLRSLDLQQPVIHLARTENGIVVPGGQKAPPTEPSDAAAPTDSEPPKIRLNALKVNDGVVVFEDLALSNSARTQFSDIDLAATRLSWPDAPHAGDFDLTMVGPDGEPLGSRGRTTDSGFDITTEVDALLLATLDGYARHYSGYSLERGDLTVKSKLSLAEDSYTSDNKLTLHRLAVGGGGDTNVFRDTFGIPLALALELLRDTDDNIVIDVPVAGDRGGNTFNLITTVRTTLQRAIANALASPLKLLNAVNITGEKVDGVGIAPIEFAPGSVEPSRGSEAALPRIAQALAGRPGLGIELSPSVAVADRDALAEQRLLRFVAAGRDLPFPRDASKESRRAIEDHLDTLLKGEPSQLGKDARAQYQQLQRQVDIPNIRLDALATARVSRLTEVLVDQYGLKDHQVAGGEIGRDQIDGPPIVKIRLAAASAPPTAQLRQAEPPPPEPAP